VVSPRREIDPAARSSPHNETKENRVTNMTAPPSSPSLVESYFGAWNARDPEAVAEAFADGGTYTDPTVTGPPLTGAAIAEHARALLTAFPDLSFEILGGQPPDEGQVITQWLMQGTNTGPWNGQPPTGRPVAMRGVDVCTVTAGKIGSVEGYFDRQGLAEQLGFQMRPLPPVAGPFKFGYAVRASAGSSKVPGAFSLTWIDARSEEEAEEIKLTAAVVAVELAQEPGFLSWVGIEIGSRLYTITAWESEDAVRAVMRNSTHLAAVKRFLTEDFAAAGSTGVWSAHHLNAVRVRCTSCARLTDPMQSGGPCACGEPLPRMPEYW
jgi:steroid delta-isomerase-like uncharacterized protein